eukprot:935514-Pleurochrysis_carterae.AAC.1
MPVSAEVAAPPEASRRAFSVADAPSSCRYCEGRWLLRKSAAAWRSFSTGLDPWRAGGLGAVMLLPVLKKAGSNSLLTSSTVGGKPDTARALA